MPRPKYSGGPKAIAARASGPSAATSSRVPRMPPLIEANREIPKARRASPRRVRAKPSKVAASAGELPGTPMAMAVIEPPYSAAM